MSGQEPKISETDRPRRSVSPYQAGLKCVCPHCGGAPLFTNLLEVRPECPACGFDFSEADPGDGAQVFVILILGALATILGIILYGVLPLWALAIVIGVFIIGAALWMLRVFKATLIALQFHHDAREGALDMKADEENRS